MTNPSLPAGSFDDFGKIDTWDEARAQTWARGLDLRAAADDQVRLRREIMSLTGLRPGDTAVEIGSGTGVLMPELGAAVGPHGRVIGIEPQPVLARLARENLARRGLETVCEVRTERGDLTTLADGIADTCIAQTVLCHLPSDARGKTLARMIRLTKKGGRVLSADQDADTWVIDHPDRDLTRRIIAFYAEQRFADGWTGRRLRGWFAAAGLTQLETRAMITVETGVDSYMYKIAIQRAEIAVQAGWITADESKGWVAALEALGATGRFFASLNFYVVAGVVP